MMITNEKLLLIGVATMAVALISSVVVLILHRIAKKRLNAKLTKEFGKRWD